ncbi:putative protein with a predicted role in nucleotide excision repair (NER) and RNA polymerase II (RNAP II) transcription [Candida albicans P60002]|nr:putative protein with a predicted role in nucleotide excision repair (NER) and RNA polymerase II (RNAP II) transcription [Candida albicans P60002]
MIFSVILTQLIIPLWHQIMMKLMIMMNLNH